MAFRGFGAPYSQSEVLTPVAVAYNRQNQIVGIQCCKIMDWQPYYGNRSIYAKNITISVLPLAYLDRYSCFSREGNTLTVYGTSRLGKVYDDGTVIEECLQALVHYSSGEGLECRLLNEVGDGCYYDFLIIGPSAAEGIVATPPTIRAMQEKGIRIYNLTSNFRMSHQSVKIDLSSANEDAQLYAGALGATFDIRDGKVVIPEDIFAQSVVVIPECSYGMIDCSLESCNNLRQLVWKGGYPEKFNLYINKCSQLRNITFPAVSRGDIKIENQHNITLNIGYDPKAADTNRFGYLGISLKDCDDVIINVNPKSETIVTLYIRGKVHIKDITSRVPIFRAASEEAVIFIDHFSSGEIVCLTPHSRYGVPSAFIQSIRGEGSVMIDGLLVGSSIDIKERLYLSPADGMYGMVSIGHLSCSQILASVTGGSNHNKKLILADIDYEAYVRDFDPSLGIKDDDIIEFRDISAQAIKDLPPVKLANVTLENIKGHFTWDTKASYFSAINCDFELAEYVTSASISNSKVIIKSSQDCIVGKKCQIDCQTSAIRKFELLDSTVIGSPKTRALVLVHYNQDSVTRGTKLLYDLNAKGCLNDVRVTLTTPSAERSLSGTIIDFTPYDDVSFNIPSLRIRLQCNSTCYGGLIMPYRCVLSSQSLGRSAKYYYLATEEQCKALAEDLVLAEERNIVLILASKELNTALKGYIKQATQAAFASNVYDKNTYDQKMGDINRALRSVSVINTGKKVSKEAFITFVTKQLASKGKTQ